MQEFDTISTLLVVTSKGILPVRLAEDVVSFSAGACSLCVVSTVSNVVLGIANLVDTVGRAPNVAVRVRVKGGAAAGVVGKDSNAGCADPVTEGGAV